jgi:hypothetical protein
MWCTTDVGTGATVLPVGSGRGVVAGDDQHFRVQVEQDRQVTVYLLDDLHLGVKVAVLASTVGVFNVAEHKVVVAPDALDVPEFASVVSPGLVGHHSPFADTPHG